MLFLNLLNYLIMFFISICLLKMGVPLCAFCDTESEQTSSEDNPEAGVGAQEAGGARPPEERKRNLEGEEGPSSSKKRRVEEQPAMSQQGGIPGETEPGPSSDKTSSAPAQSNSSTWSGSWIGNWLNQGQEVSSSSAPNQSSPQLSPDSQWNELVQSYRVGEINPPAPPAAPPAPAVIENQLAPPAQEHNQGVNIPELEQPLLPDDVRREELAGRLGVHFMGRQDHALLPALLDKQMQLETNIEAALVDAGFDPASILLRRHAIRGIIFYPQGSPLSEKALEKYMAEILRRGTQESLPFQRILRAIKKYELDLR